MNSVETVNFEVRPGSVLQGELRVPGDKSISHRALMLGAIAEGTTTVQGFLDSEDIKATMAALRMMGVNIEEQDNNNLRIEGVGLHGLHAPGRPLDLGNSGTSVRLFAGLLSGQQFATELLGDQSLMQRPMRRIVEPLQQMGAQISCSEHGTLPIKIVPTKNLSAIRYVLPVASAQLKSALLLAGLYADGKTCVHEPSVTRDHSERMLSQFGCTLETENGEICLQANTLTGQDIIVPGDISSAAFFIVAASIIPGSNLLLKGVGLNPSRDAIIEILLSMGADIEIDSLKADSGEPVADLRVRHSKLVGITIPEHLVPIAIDEMPVLMIAAACAEGETRLSGAAELRVKESDRIKAMCEGLNVLGIEVEEKADGMTVRGGEFASGTVYSHEDHRIAMAFSIAALAASGPVVINDCANVDTSFPSFQQCFTDLGMSMTVHRLKNA
ncbi:MAG: 3-phosphoshikimate 1-carboxyvinyltransferase [Gammaproteobacteria bacterium]|nr:3-phosphoshikimate 1-carboxyvinyltransferase [Gammaproteobacteria bacterium]